MKHALRLIVSILVILFIVHLFQRPPQPMAAPREEVWLVMGTVASLRVPATEREHFPEMLQIAKDTFATVNTKLSMYQPESELARLQQNGYLDPISPLTHAFLKTAIEMTARADGFFDPTLLPVIQLWGFSGGKTPTNLPTSQQISTALHRPRLSDLQLSATEARYAAKPAPIDPGGIAKGFALDLAFDKIQEVFPASHFLLNLGGEMRAKGMAETDRPWRIGIQHPFEKQATIGRINMPHNFAVATSGHYERFFYINGERYAHILDPATGWPAKGMAGVTVLSPSSTEADVLSTALFVAGLENASKLLNAFPASEALLIPDREPITLYVTPGLQKWFEPLPPFQNRIKIIPENFPTPYE